MIITQRIFIIPETIEEQELILSDKKYEKQTSYIDKKSITYFTNRESDAALISFYADKVRQLYSFQTINIKNKTSAEIAKKIKNLPIQPTILIDLRTHKKVEEMPDCDLKYIANKLNLMFYSIPNLSIDNKRTTGFNTVKDLLIHKKMLFIGTNNKSLNIILEHMNKTIKAI